MEEAGAARSRWSPIAAILNESSTIRKLARNGRRLASRSRTTVPNFGAVLGYGVKAFWKPTSAASHSSISRAFTAFRLRRIRIRNPASTVTSDSDVGLFGVAEETLKYT